MTVRAGLRRAVGEGSGSAGDGPLAGVDEAAAARRWLDVYQALSGFDRGSALGVQDLELLATAAFMCGHAQECHQVRLRTYQVAMGEGDVRRAVRCAVRIGLERLSVGEVAEAVGCLPMSMSACSAWVAQATALLDQVDDGAEHGFLLIPVAYERLAMHHDLDGAASTAAEAVAIGRRFADVEVLAFGLTVQGRALMRSGRVNEGMALLDEAVTLALTDGIPPLGAGLVLTSAVDASLEVFELDRFDAWCDVLVDWCDRQHGMVAFRCRALAHRAAWKRRRGRWREARALADRACEPAIAELDPTAAAAARYEQGEILRLQGRFEAAEAAYRQASQGGLDPQPGLALLRLADDDVEAARSSLARAAGEARDELGKARLLPAQVEVLLAAGDHAAAHDSAGQLEQIAQQHATPALEAAAHESRAGVLLTEGDPAAALTAVRRACRVWRHFGLPYEEARARLLIARCCRMLDDHDTAALELDAARGIFSRLEARPDLDRAGRLLGRDAPASTYGMTPRELEVLRLLATGLTNRAIADELRVTTRTVDTHVSRILTKLGVPTRAAATAFVHRHDLL